ncbi:glycoside hydrolase family 88/105 protein [Neptunicella sp. SCSIO 80796]|uniref:glycoside hydrolase family 88/105 protein n=1 Tax=Neptunicella plasticusilytica TaxID=3117012 RepID=UPI003A4D41D2
MSRFSIQIITALITTLVSTLAIANPAKPFWASALPPQKVGEQVITDLLRHDNYMMYISDHFTGIHYAEAALGYAALKFADQTGNSKLLNQLQKRYQQTPGTDKLVEADHVDANVYGIVPLQRYLISHDLAARKQGLMLADAQWLKPLQNGMSHQIRYWIDDIWMVNALQMQAYRVTQNQQYLQRAALQTVAYLEKLQQDNGLFFHGEKAPFFWGRGNGWVAAGLAELLTELPADNPYYPQIVSGYRKMMDALINYQADDGMWRQLVNNKQAWKETSATAMFGYAILVGVEKGILTEPEYTRAYQRAWLGLMHYLNDNGQLTDVCVGTGQSDDMQYYLQRPTTVGDYHGQAPLLWFVNRLLGLSHAN